MSGNKDKSGQYHMSDEERVARKLEEIQRTATDSAVETLLEDEYTPPPHELPEAIKKHWENQNNRILMMQQQVRLSEPAAIIRTLESMHHRVANLERSNRTLMRIVGALAIILAGSLGAAYSAVRNSGERDGELHMRVEANHNDIEELKQDVRFLLRAKTAVP